MFSHNSQPWQLFLYVYRCEALDLFLLFEAALCSEAANIVSEVNVGVM